MFIDKDKLISALEDVCGGSGVGLTVKEEMLDIVRSFPTADVQEVKHGKWLKKGGKIVCSRCGTVNFLEPNYCPDCGAKMDGKENEG